MKRQNNEKIFFERLEKIDPAIISALKLPKKRFSFRINRLKTTNDEVLDKLEKVSIVPKRVEWFEDAYVLPLEERQNLIKTDLYTDGKIYIQNLSSMVAALELSLKEDEWLLDLASAPGGKALLWSSLLENRGKISAVEPDRNRFFMLKRNFKISGAKNIRAYQKDGRTIGKRCPEYFDKVLLDAPCSSESKFDLSIENPVKYWSIRRVYRNSRLQKELILSAWESLKPGGVLVYATCTFSPEENEEVVNFLLEKRADAFLTEPDIILENFKSGLTFWEGRAFDESLKKAVRIVPDGLFDGFFLAKIKKVR
ncbi:RsmB/NOP family class I SAM-dependent RNA methyltransferase [Nitrosophilus alvini]|uniref:RsmB/NOP family class I SAM-dependent RNA methyltransferase n=1 Tax=Nitrosophilus alvini TaxID=2714855 RepID=UPI001F283322|nr:RsmB/NOP family class I SAM-dependent RNA methyltransferase [Nitrosophilus alvini]